MGGGRDGAHPLMGLSGECGHSKNLLNQTDQFALNPRASVRGSGTGRQIQEPGLCKAG